MASGAMAAHVPEHKLFELASKLWQVYEQSAKRGPVAWPVDSLAKIYADYFNKLLNPRDYGVESVEKLLEKVPIFTVKDGFANVSKEKLLKFLVVPVLRNARMREKRFQEKFKEVTGLRVDCVYDVSGTKNFSQFANFLHSKMGSLFKTNNKRGVVLFIAEDSPHLPELSPERGVSHASESSTPNRPQVDGSYGRSSAAVTPSGRPQLLPTPSSKFRSSHARFKDGLEAAASLDSPPPLKIRCTQPITSTPTLGQPIRVHVSSRPPLINPLIQSPNFPSPSGAPMLHTVAAVPSSRPPLIIQSPNFLSPSGASNYPMLHTVAAVPMSQVSNSDVQMSESSSQPLPGFLPLETNVFPQTNSGFASPITPRAVANRDTAAYPRIRTAGVATPIAMTPPPAQAQSGSRVNSRHSASQPLSMNNPEVFPNPDTPDEVFLPSHPNFHPRMVPPSSSLSTAILSFTDKKGRPISTSEAAKKINSRLDAMIDDLASAGKFIPESVVKDFANRLLQQCRYARCVVGFRDLRVFEDYGKRHGRVAELIKIFCWMSPITTVHELERALVSVEGVTRFEDMRIGPLIKHPLVAKFFQPPSDLQEVPEITAHQIQKTLFKFLDKTRRAAGRGEKHSMEDFLQFFAKNESKPSPHHLCVRITSFPLAIQTNFRFRRMQNECRSCMQQKIEEEMKAIIAHETDRVRRKLTSSLNDPLSINRHVAHKDPIVLLSDVFGVFLQYLSGYQNTKVTGFLQLLSNQQWVRQMFLWAIYEGAYGVEKGIGEIREDERVLPTARRQPEEMLHKTHGEVLEVILRHLNRLPFPIDLPSLAAVERAIADHFGAPSFQVLTNTSFLDFLASDRQCQLSLGGSLTIGTAPTDDGRKRRVMAIVSQLGPSERNNQETVSETLKLQCGVTAVDQLHCGSIAKLISDATVREGQGMGTATQRSVSHLAPLLVNGAREVDSYKQWSCPRVGVLGHKTRENAVTCLQRAPLLEDLASWSHWDLVFKPQYGELAEFIESDGPRNGLHALEIAPGTLLRVDPEASHQKFVQAVEARDPVNTAGQLVSVVVLQGSVHEVSLQLLGNHVQTALQKMASEFAQVDTEEIDGTILATQFVYRCLVRIPHKICHFLAKEVFLEPLRRISSATAVEDLLHQCNGAAGSREGRKRRCLQALGMGLGIKAWADDFNAMLNETDTTGVSPHNVGPIPVATLEPYHMDGPMCTPDDADAFPEAHPPSPSPMSANADLATAQESKPDDPTSLALPLSEAEVVEKEAKCREVVESIRSEDFGIGLELDGRQKEIAEKQRQREGRGLQRLSKELYSKDTHFVLELIQNADDNSYHKSLLLATAETVPALKFVVGSSSVSVLNNELGFSEKNVRAICDVGKSTKGAHRSGYIGQKGIGFKSVFRVTDMPEIHSGGYHIRFDAQSDAIGYILPHWIEENDRESTGLGKGWNTAIVLPLKEDQQSVNLVRKFQDIRPSLLLFLHRLRSITVEDQISGAVRYMKRSDSTHGIIQIEHDAGQDTWLVVRKQLSNASQLKTDVEATEVALAFPLSADMRTVVLAKDLQQQQVFAYLPLRSYGFRFIVQGDFDLPSSREDVNSDSAWNQWLRSEIPQLFLHALENMKALPGLSLTDAVALFLQFIPLDGELHDFFKPVAVQILNLLRGTACLPTEQGSEDVRDAFSIVQSISHRELENSCDLPHLWKQPSQLVVVRDNFIRKYIPQELLNSSLHLFYLSLELTSFVNSSLQAQLGVQTLSIDLLIAVADAVLKSYSGGSHNVIMLSDNSDGSLTEESDDEIEIEGNQRNSKKVPCSPHATFVQWVAQWLACVQIVLEEERNRSPPTLDKLKKIKIIPLTNGSRIAAQDGSVFFPADGESVSSSEFKGLFDEISVVDPLVFEAWGDSGVDEMVKPSHRAHSVLELLGVREMFPAEIIRHHILPSFQTDHWKSKSLSLLTTYLVYIKDNLGVPGSGVTEAEIVSLLRDCVALATKKHGAQQPAREVLHFSSQFQPVYDLEKLFPDVPWMLVSPNYLKNFRSREGILSWRNFLQKLGIHSRLAVRKFNEHVQEGCDRWQELREFVGRSPDGAYTLRDYQCSEFEEIVRSVKPRKKRGHAEQEQTVALVQLLDKLWDEEYRQCAFAQCYDGVNENYLGGETVVPSSFHRALKDVAWLPGVSLPSGQPFTQNSTFYKGHELFDRANAIQRLLDCHVPYIGVELKNPKLLELLQVKCRIDAEEMIGFLQEWSKASTTAGTQFQANTAHMTEVYMFLYRQMVQGSVDEQKIIDAFSSTDMIFVPDVHVHDGIALPSTPAVGSFYSLHNVCWVDPSSVLYTKQRYNHKLPPELPRVLQLHYEIDDPQKHQELKHAFLRFGINEYPTSASYISTLNFISSLMAVPEKHDIDDFTSIALHLSRLCMQARIPPAFLQQQVRGNKVFPTHRNVWVSLDSCLLENDDSQLAKYFSECSDVHFLQWPATFQKKLQRRQRPEDLQKEEERKHFIDVCSIARLSEVLHTSVEPGSVVMPLVSLQRKLHIMVPLIQRYLAANEENLYQMLQEENLKGKLSSIFIGSVFSLTCIYSIVHHGKTYTSPVSSSPGCEFKDSSGEGDLATLYVVSSKVDNPKCLVPALMKIFTSNQTVSTDPTHFESFVKDLLLTSEEEMESILTDSRYQFAEVNDDDKWIIRLPNEPERAISEDSESSADEDTSNEREPMEAEERREFSDSAGLKSWPPKAPAWAGGSSQHPARPPPLGSSVADMVGDDEVQKIAEKYAMQEKPAAERKSDSKMSRQTSHEQATSPSVSSQSTAKHSQDHNEQHPPFSQSLSSSSQLSSSHPSKQHANISRGDYDNEYSNETREGGANEHLHSGAEANVPFRKNEKKWQESTNPEAALAKSSVSIAAALQSIPLDSCNQLLPFLEEYDAESRERVGRWGEEYVYRYLEHTQKLPDDQSIQSVTWVNQTLETGLPYDIEVQIDPETVVYVEVKSTKSPDKELMEFSWKELKFSEKKKQNFHLYRVYSAGSEAVVLKWMENISDVLEKRPVRLFLEL